VVLAVVARCDSRGQLVERTVCVCVCGCERARAGVCVSVCVCVYVSVCVRRGCGRVVSVKYSE
jgi:hypothetical protein